MSNQLMPKLTQKQWDIIILAGMLLIGWLYLQEVGVDTFRITTLRALFLGLVVAVVIRKSKHKTRLY